MIYRVIQPPAPIRTSVVVPASKSISNRLLIIHALAGKEGMLENLSDSDDTDVMIRALTSESEVKDVGHAGTSMRFLTAYFSARPGTVVMTGSERMKERPIGPLVEALRFIGAEIEYEEKEGYPPLRILGKNLEGGMVSIPGNVSSQFISALLMIAPRLKAGIELELTGNIVSGSYIRMTLELMKQAGIASRWNGNTITIEPGNYRVGHSVVESDWSGASYWYAMALLDPEAQISIRHFENDSLQGDSVLKELFSLIDVQTVSGADVLLLTKSSIQDQSLSQDTLNRPQRSDYSKEHPFRFDFTNSPDLVQTLAVALCLTGIPFHLTGTETLRIKETDRISALQTELKKLGFILASDPSGSFLSWNGDRTTPEDEPLIETYHDHRMAMAFAAASLKTGSIRINDPMVVTKSYPSFWEDLQQAGFRIEKA